MHSSITHSRALKTSHFAFVFNFPSCTLNAYHARDFRSIPRTQTCAVDHSNIVSVPIRLSPVA